jgi:beta-lactamase class A
MSTPEALQEQIEDLARAFPGTAGVAAHNLATGASHMLNAEEQFPTASMIKTQVLFELIRQDARGQAPLSERITLRAEDKSRGSGLLLDFDPGAVLTLRDAAVLMMAISDNTATNMLVDRLGIEAVNQTCRDGGMSRTELRNKIDWSLIGDEPEKLAVGTPADFCRFFTLLRQGELLPPAHVERMLAVMRIQKYIEPLRKHLPFDPYGDEFDHPQEVWVASKTGGMKGVRCEGGLVHTPAAEWAICVMT